MLDNQAPESMHLDEPDNTSDEARRRAVEAAQRRHQAQSMPANPSTVPHPHHTTQHKWTRDPNFFAPTRPGNLVFLVEETLFCIHIWDFTTISPVLASLGELGQMAENHTSQQEESLPPDGQPAGGEPPNSESNPIVLGAPTTTAGFRALLKWVHPHHHEDGPLSQSEWRVLLPVAHFYQVDKAFKAAVTELSPTRYYIEPTERLWCALSYQIPEWIRSTLEDLIESDDRLSKDQEDRLKHFHEPAFRNLMAVRAALIRHRHRLILAPPDVIHTEVCKASPTTTQCRERWDRIWRDTCLHLIACNRWVRGKRVEMHLQSAVDLVQQSTFSECLQSTFNDVKGRGVLWCKEQTIEEQGMENILGPSFLLPLADV